MSEPLLTPAMQAAVGTPGETRSVLIERGAIIRFADAIGDDNPRYRGDAPVAPPTFLRSIGLSIPHLPDAEHAPLVLDGGSEWTYSASIHAGDTITCATKLEKLTEREGRHGPMLIATYFTEYSNQHGHQAATQRNTLIRMRAAT